MIAFTPDRQAQIKKMRFWCGLWAALSIPIYLFSILFVEFIAFNDSAVTGAKARALQASIEHKQWAGSIMLLVLFIGQFLSFKPAWEGSSKAYGQLSC